MKNNNLISISGRIGSGKDLLGKIFQALIDKPTCFDKLDVITEEDIDYAIWDKPSFEIKKFADKLKDMVCILLDCTREQLEDRKFKEKDLGEEWKCFEIYNPETHNTVKIVLTESEAIDFIEDNYELHFYQIRKRTLTPRLLLQLLGTQCGRDILHPNVWVNALMSGYRVDNTIRKHTSIEDYEDLFIDLTDKNHRDLLKGYEIKNNVSIIPNWIITDTRFPNEFEAIKSRGGICIKIEREVKNINGMCKDKCDNFPDCKPCGDMKPLHESETALDNQTFDYIFLNNGSIKELVEAAKKFLKDYGYIK